MIQQGYAHLEMLSVFHPSAASFVLHMLKVFDLLHLMSFLVCDDETMGVQFFVQETEYVLLHLVGHSLAYQRQGLHCPGSIVLSHLI